MKFATLVTIILFSCIQHHAQKKAPSHEGFTQLLQKYVSPEGKVNYPGFIRDSVALNQYLALLSANPPETKNWSDAEQMAFWINAYNAYTIKLIAQYYPIKSIKDIGSTIQIPFVNTPWDIKFIRIGAERMDLNNIEHGILRKKFKDPRIHMALVCASRSCPVLLNEAYEPSRLDEQLTRQAKAFLADEQRNRIAPGHAEVSMIFNWYGSDFDREAGSVRDFINTYAPTKINSDVPITFLDYDWRLNE